MSNASTKHPDYNRYEADWQKIRDAVAGESVIKKAAEKY